MSDLVSEGVRDHVGNALQVVELALSEVPPGEFTREMVEAVRARLRKALDLLDGGRQDDKTLRARVAQLEGEIAGWWRYKHQVDEACNSVDGCYRP